MDYGFEFWKIKLNSIVIGFMAGFALVCLIALIRIIAHQLYVLFLQ
jgi:tetrahydromethanopterin S-methyltransferase subunit B